MKKSLLFFILAVLFLSVGAGCSDDDNGSDTQPPPEEQESIGVESGEYAVAVAFKPLGGLELPFKLDLTVSEDGQTIESAKLYPVGDEQIGGLAVEATGITREDDEPLVIDFPLGTLPGEYTPTGSDVTFDIALTIDLDADLLCGTVAGVLPSVGNLDIDGSTFGATQWEGVGTVAPSSCTGDEVVECERMKPEDCPTLVVGDNTGFVSCGIERSFKLLNLGSLPMQKATKGRPAPYPLIFSWHGLGGSADRYLPAAGWNDSNALAYVVMPNGRGLDATEYAQTTTEDNPDLAFFDDLVTCTKAQLDVDEHRIYSEGMSAGGLFTSYLAVMRPEVLAAATPFSGGLIIDYPEPNPQIPLLISWGGEDDRAVGQNFNTFALTLIDEALVGGHFVVACDHGGGHTRKPEWTSYALRFMFDHPKGMNPSPYIDNGLPAVFPDFCTIRTLSE